MKIKTKLTLGVGLLFILILLLTVVGAKYINDLKHDTENILVANYNSLQYANNILGALEQEMPYSFEIIDQNLKLQENNITEIGEAKLTNDLRFNINLLKNNHSDSTILKNLRKGIFTMMDMNMDAIQRKSQLAKATAENAVFWIALTGTVCFLIAFILLVNLPSNIANPITELTSSIKQIANEKYSERVHFESHSEFGELAHSFNTMAEKLEEYNNSNLSKLMMEKKRIETLINNMHDPVIGLDENLKVIFANEEALKITGIRQEEIIGKDVKDLAVYNDLIRTLVQDLVISESAGGSKSKPIKIFSNSKEGYFEKEIHHISVTPTGEQLKQVIGHVIILRNITEFKELDTAKTNFIATVSHEFKTPISSIKMSVELLKNEQIGKLNEEQTNLLNSIHDDSNRLLKITGELLNMTQVESGNIQLSIFPANPAEILNFAMNATQTQADYKQIRFEKHCPEDIPNVLVDNEKTAWVLTNLLSNAIRYSYEHATIYLSIKKLDNQVQISVRDTGQGIAPQYKDKIFDRYFKVPGTKKEGTGLGLAISKEFIEAQKGQIKVDSEFGAGSTFTIILNSVS